MGGGNIGIFSMGDVTTILESSHVWPLCGTDEHEQRARARRSPFPSAEIRFPKIKAVDRNEADPDENSRREFLLSLLATNLLTGVGVSSRIRSLLAKSNNRPLFFQRAPSSLHSSVLCGGGLAKSVLFPPSGRLVSRNEVRLPQDQGRGRLCRDPTEDRRVAGDNLGNLAKGNNARPHGE